MPILTVAEIARSQSSRMLMDPLCITVMCSHGWLLPIRSTSCTIVICVIVGDNIILRFVGVTYLFTTIDGSRYCTRMFLILTDFTIYILATVNLWIILPVECSIVKFTPRAEPVVSNFWGTSSQFLSRVTVVIASLALRYSTIHELFSGASC